MAIMRVPEDEEDMTDAFFDYMLGIDTEIKDIAIQFKTSLYDIETFGKELLEELGEMVDTWNNLEKKPGIPFTAIDWKPDHSLAVTKDNYAALFVKNLNAFTNRLQLPEGTFVVPMLFFYSRNKQLINLWLEHMMEAGLHEKIKLLVADTFELPVFNECLKKFPDSSLLITPELKMSQAMEQLAAMGKPNDPETLYRLSFIKLTNAIAAKNESGVICHSDECLRIASVNIGHNPYWASQIVAVYFTLGIYKVSLKEFIAAISFATKALEAALATRNTISNEMCFRNIGQSAMFRGSLHYQQKQWEKSLEDFTMAEMYYGNCKDRVLQIEALRMKACAAKKYGAFEEEMKSLITGVRMGKSISPSMAQASSYRLLLRQMLFADYREHISYEEIDEVATPLLGDDWEEMIVQLETAY